MRPSLLLLLLPAVFACSTNDDAATVDTSSPASAVTPASLTPGDVAGNWTGMTMAENGDSVLSRWTLSNESDSTGVLVLAATNDTVPFRVSFMGDSMVAVSEPYKASAASTAPMVVFNSTGRLRDGKLVGTVLHKAAANPDSTVGRARWEASRTP